ncbi:MAG: GTPase Era [Aquificaceae bacterium]|nr:MAG: GTPase Era [Aquificaceae bacterium]
MTEDDNTALPTTRCGYVAIVGRPNVGKSTLLNHLVGYRISAIVNKPQTTRTNVRGIVTKDNFQVIFTDTPGIHHDSKTLMNKTLNIAAVAALDSVDAVVMLVEAVKWTAEDDLVLQRLEKMQCPVFLLINKVDRISEKNRLFSYIDSVRSKRDFVEIMPISATKGINTEELLQKIKSLLPFSEYAFDEDSITDQSLRSICSEVIREQLMNQLHQEIPYSVAVNIEKFTEMPYRTDIDATIWVGKARQKGIVIGKKGETLKRVGIAARKILEELLETKVVLKTFVRVEENWQNNPKNLSDLGIITR